MFPHKILSYPTHTFHCCHREGECGFWHGKCGQRIRRKITSAAVFIWDVVSPEPVIHTVPVINSIESFRSLHVLAVISTGSLVRSSIIISESMTQNMLQNFELLHLCVPLTGNALEASGVHIISESQSQTRLSINERTQRRPQTRPKIRTKTLWKANMHMNTQSVVQGSIDTLIDVLNTQAFAEDLNRGYSWARTHHQSRLP